MKKTLFAVFRILRYSLFFGLTLVVTMSTFVVCANLSSYALGCIGIDGAWGAVITIVSALTFILDVTAHIELWFIYACNKFGLVPPFDMGRPSLFPRSIIYMIVKGVKYC